MWLPISLLTFPKYTHPEFSWLPIVKVKVTASLKFTSGHYKDQLCFISFLFKEKLIGPTSQTDGCVSKHHATYKQLFVKSEIPRMSMYA